MDTPSPSLRAFAAIACGYWTMPGRRLGAWTLVAGMVALAVVNVSIQLWLNLWNRDFFNALEKRDLPALLDLLWVLAEIVVAGGVCVAVHLHVKRRLQVGYNRAARMIERMEQEGVVSVADHRGAREVLARSLKD